MKYFCIIIIIIIIIYFLLYICKFYFQRIILRNMAHDVITELNKHDIYYWIDFGTLLGIIRDKDIIWRDNDVDISVIDSPELHRKMKLVGNSLLKKGYKFKKMDWSAYRVYKFGYFFTDIYINKYNHTTNTYLGALGTNSNINSLLIGTPINIFWDMKNIFIKCPEKIHETLVWRYGEDYNIPKHNFKGRVV